NRARRRVRGPRQYHPAAPVLLASCAILGAAKANRPFAVKRGTTRDVRSGRFVVPEREDVPMNSTDGGAQRDTSGGQPVSLAEVLDQIIPKLTAGRGESKKRPSSKCDGQQAPGSAGSSVGGQALGRSPLRPT